eukprot:CAMPEP_0170085342 /NCGR_PEP_ID=MMETSP0019_2-20121128/20256_1 /TAXON_ID=98059 /ORGANISM="Dinobryon sp., Strain UTEXLB2267" /LENGTH=485 /DNA_ID=CAMNT_0010301769 /DNA_START=452 /DNA_END=1910 /DNA_ORIENTATION=+
MYRAKCQSHFHYKSFSVSAFHNLAKLQNGDVSWIVPGKFIAFSGPISKRRQTSSGEYTLSPEEYVPLFKSLGVSCVVRFNSKCYDRNVFVSNGIRHVDLFYEDGGNPTEAILQSFLQLCEAEKGAVAVHCKAGLGRTGTNIAAYMMKHYSYTARESIAWCRLCRPGSIVGPQQQYLASIDEKMASEGKTFRQKQQSEKKLAALSIASGGGVQGAHRQQQSHVPLLTAAASNQNNNNNSHNNGLSSMKLQGSQRSNGGPREEPQLPSTSLTVSKPRNDDDVALQRPSTSAGILSAAQHPLKKASNDASLASSLPRPASTYGTNSSSSSSVQAWGKSRERDSDDGDSKAVSGQQGPAGSTGAVTSRTTGNNANNLSGNPASYSNRVRRNVHASREQSSNNNGLGVKAVGSNPVSGYESDSKGRSATKPGSGSNAVVVKNVNDSNNPNPISSSNTNDHGLDHRQALLDPTEKDSTDSETQNYYHILAI